MKPFNGETTRDNDRQEVALRQLFVRTAVGIVAETEIRSQVYIPDSLPQSSTNGMNVISLDDRRDNAAAAIADATAGQDAADELANNARAAIEAA